ncbi:MAG: hypothetical protein E7062_05205 [Spirochaetaceae bacterium]|nr:hypothetical protein [Spirochaetaceae bacterium]
MTFDEISPEIAALLDDTSKPTADPLFQAMQPRTEKSVQPKQMSNQPTGQSDSNNQAFKTITEFYNSKVDPIYTDPNYYKTVLSNEDTCAQKLHTVLTKYLTSKDSKDKVIYRQQITTAYWEVFNSIAPKMAFPATPDQKRLMLRFGILLPTLMTQEQRELFGSIFPTNTHGQPVYYVDEWIRDILTQKLSLSATDERSPRKNSSPEADASRLAQLQTKNNSKIQMSEGAYASKESERTRIENDLQSLVDQIASHATLPNLPNHYAPLTDEQKRAILSAVEKLKALQKIDKELFILLQECEEARSISLSLNDKLSAINERGAAVSTLNNAELDTELKTIRQMAKMTVGRQGNHFPLFTKEFFHCAPRSTGTRENVLSILQWIESIDPGVFVRIHKNKPNRIVPYTLLLPTYGDMGLCWEPFDRYNRVSSRGRIVVPMYPKNLQIAVLTAVADLRWQVAKEKASYYWMEEGLTGHYYQWFDLQKLKGDVKDYFINDYVLWITKESEGVQRLDKEVRAVFWRHMPFPQEIKDKLKTRSMIYQELCQRDMNRAMSDGY